MKKTKLKHIIFFAGALAVLALLVILLVQASPKITLFYGDTCPHCEELETYIGENDIEDKVDFRRLEVFRSQPNAKLLSAKAASCGLNQQSVGVPFLYDGQKCYMGLEEVKGFFEQYE